MWGVDFHCLHSIFFWIKVERAGWQEAWQIVCMYMYVWQIVCRYMYGRLYVQD